VLFLFPGLYLFSLSTYLRHFILVFFEYVAKIFSS